MMRRPSPSDGASADHGLRGPPPAGRPALSARPPNPKLPVGDDGLALDGESARLAIYAQQFARALDKLFSLYAQPPAGWTPKRAATNAATPEASSSAKQAVGGEGGEAQSVAKATTSGSSG